MVNVCRDARKGVIAAPVSQEHTGRDGMEILPLPTLMLDCTLQMPKLFFNQWLTDPGLCLSGMEWWSYQ